MGHWINTVRTYLQALQHLFYPHICLQCGMDELHRKQIICDDCETQLPFTHFEQMQNNDILLFCIDDNIYKFKLLLSYKFV